MTMKYPRQTKRLVRISLTPKEAEALLLAAGNMQDDAEDFFQDHRDAIAFGKALEKTRTAILNQRLTAAIHKTHPDLVRPADEPYDDDDGFAHLRQESDDREAFNDLLDQQREQ